MRPSVKYVDDQKKNIKKNVVRTPLTEFSGSAHVNMSILFIWSKLFPSFYLQTNCDPIIRKKY